MLRNEGCLRANDGLRVRRCAGYAGELHGGEIVDVVAHEGDLGEIQLAPRREGAEGRGFILAALDDVGEAELCGVTVDQGAVLTRDQGDDQAGLDGQRGRESGACSNGGTDAAQLLDDRVLALVDTLHAVAHRLLDEADVANEAADAVGFE